jgi:hypothetical protein
VVVLLNVALIEVVLYSLLLLKSSSADFSSADELIVLIENPILFIEDFLFVPGYRGPPQRNLRKAILCYIPSII